MNGRTIARILLAVILIGGAIGIGVTSYNAGVTAGLVQSGQAVVVPGGYPVAPGAAYVGYGWGFGHGFGFFGFFGGLLFLFLLIGLLRAAFGGHRRGWGPGGPGGMGGPGGDWRRDAWEQRVKDTHDALHRDASDRPDKPAGS
jgi:hypothetical protein